MSHNIIREANRCIQCKNPRCVAACPVSTQIPEMIDMFLKGDIKDAGQMLFDNNPLSIICGLICHHEAQCEGSCVLGIKGNPVDIGGIEHYISDYNLDTLELTPAEKKKQKVGIIGSGPAGITIAFILALKGYDITIFESHDKIGGVLRYGVPEFRLSKDVLERMKTRLEDLGVKIRPNTLIGPVITIDDLFRDGYHAVFIGTGVWNPKKMGIKGESLGNVHYAIDYLKNPAVYNLGKTVTVIGAGNVAIDVARTAIRRGARDVSIVYRKGAEDVPASDAEVRFALMDGVKFDYFKSPIELRDDGILALQTEKNDGSYKNVEGSEALIKSDSIIVSVSQVPKTNIVSNSKGIEISKWGLVITDTCGRTTREGIFASGDVVTGAKTVVDAVKYSKRVADAMAHYLEKLTDSL